MDKLSTNVLNEEIQKLSWEEVRTPSCIQLQPPAAASSCSSGAESITSHEKSLGNPWGPGGLEPGISSGIEPRIPGIIKQLNQPSGSMAKVVLLGAMGNFSHLIGYLVIIRYKRKRWSTMI